MSRVSTVPVRKHLLSATIVVVSVLVTPGVGPAAGHDETYGLNAALDVLQQKPPQSVPVRAAVGTFSATLKLSGSASRLSWRLTFTHLSGRALQAHIHRGRLGKSGPVAATLCNPCKAEMRGSQSLSAGLVRAIKSGGAYVDVHTKKNMRGEIRGQIRLITGTA
ncbi:MAG: hypothetical protein QOC92_1568 [Acidimicrobiaceae bacterium]|jgi:hypothetical protein